MLGYVGEISPERAEAQPQPKRLPRRRQDRQGRGRGDVRRVPPRRCRARRRSASTRSAGRRAPLEPSARRAPGNAVRLTIDIGSSAPPSGRSGTGSQLAHERTSQWQRERRRDRRARPARRRGPRDGVVPDLQAVGLRRPRRPEEARAARRTTTAAKEANYPGLNRAIAGRLPARLDVQAGDRARGDAGAPALAVRSRSSARRPRRTASTSRSSRTGTRT